MDLLIYCAGGLGMEIMDIAHRLNRHTRIWNRISFIDDSVQESKINGSEVYRFEDALKLGHVSSMEMAIASGEPFVREAIKKKIEFVGIKLATLVDNNAIISDSAKISSGAIIFPGCFVSSMAFIGCNVAIIAGSLIGHNSSLGDNCVVSGQVNIGGACTIGSESYIGMGTQVKEHTRVGRAAIVGMGSIVFKDIPDEVIALGNPCRPMKPNTNKRVFN